MTKKKKEETNSSNKKVKPTTTVNLEVPTETWARFKDITPSSKNLKNAVVELIEEKVKER